MTQRAVRVPRSTRHHPYHCCTCLMLVITGIGVRRRNVCGRCGKILVLCRLPGWAVLRRLPA